MSGRRKGGQVTPPRTALAAGEITAPSLLARDVHKLCITASGAHMSEPREKRRIARPRSHDWGGRGCDIVGTSCSPAKEFNSQSYRGPGFRIG